MQHELTSHRLLRLVTLVLGVASVGCTRTGDQPANVAPGSGSGPASIQLAVAEAQAPTVAMDAQVVTVPADAQVPTSGLKPLNGVCPQRKRGRDPGPTKVAGSAPRLGPSAETADVKDACLKHAECIERLRGRCVHQHEYETNHFGQRRFIPAHNECVYDECTSDDECRRTTIYEPRAESVCTCTDERNTCTFANCRKDSDCPSPFPCGPWHYCHSAADTCRASSNCKAGEDCIYSWEVKHYVCKQQEHIAPD
jgi:hypothetical protein